MKTVSDTLTGLLISGGYAVQLRADVYYDDELTLPNLPVVGWTLQSDLEQQIKTVGTLQVAYTGDFGESLTPRQLLGTVAPYGAEVNVWLLISTGGWSETVDVGRFRITAVPTAKDTFTRIPDGSHVTLGTVLTLTVEDLLVTVARNGIHGPQPPVELDSTWHEIRRLAGLPVLRTLPDRAPPEIVYEPKQGGRLDAVQALASWLGGVAVMTSDGEVTVIPFQPGVTVATVTLGPGKTIDEGGTVLDVDSVMDSDQLFNEVVGTYQADDGTPWYGNAAIQTGPLAVDGPFGRYTYYDSAQGIQTQAAADERAQDVLDRLRLAQAYQATVTVIPRPDLDLGDVVEVTLPAGGSLTGRIIAQTLTGATGDGNSAATFTHTITLDMARTVYL